MAGVINFLNEIKWISVGKISSKTERRRTTSAVDVITRRKIMKKNIRRPNTRQIGQIKHFHKPHVEGKS